MNAIITILELLALGYEYYTLAEGPGLDVVFYPDEEVPPEVRALIAVQREVDEQAEAAYWEEVDRQINILQEEDRYAE